MFDRVMNMHLQSATHCLEKLRMLIRLIQLQHLKFKHNYHIFCLTLSKTIMIELLDFN